MTVHQELAWIARVFQRDPESRTNAPIRILHFPCGSGELLACLATLLRPAITYGAGPRETDRVTATVDHFCLASSLEDLRVGRRAFDLVILDLDRILPGTRPGSIRKARASTSAGNHTVLLFSGYLSREEITAAAHNTGTDDNDEYARAVRLASGRTALVLTTPTWVQGTRDDHEEKDPAPQVRQAVSRITRALSRPAPERDGSLAFKIRPWNHLGKPVFAPLWLDADYVSKCLPATEQLPPEYLDEDPATPNLRPAMPLRKGHLALAAVSGAMGVLRVTIRGRPAALCGRVVREEQTTTEHDGRAAITTITQSFKPQITILFLDNMEILRA